MNMKDMKLRFWKFFKDKWPYILIILVVCTFFWKVFLQNKVPLPADFVVGAYYPWLDYKWEGFPAGVPVKNPITTDVVSFSYPMRMLAIKLLKEGEIPLWNQYILGGTPLLANFQSAPFSPSNIFYFLFDKLSAWSAQIILQHILVSIFTYLLLRNWKVSRLASMVGGMVFAFSGFNLIWSQWNAHVLTASFIPLLLLFSDKWLSTGKWKYGAGISIALFFQIVSGYPQIIFYTLIALIILWFIRLNKKKYYLVRSCLLGFFIALGIGLSAFQILPAAELLSFSQREIEAHPFEWAFLPWSKTITFLAPDFFGNHSTGNYWGPQDYTSNTGFVGIVAFSLALGSIHLRRKKKEVIFGIVLILVSLVLAYPTPIAILNWKSGFFGLQAASAHRALILFTFGISILSAFGLDVLVRKNKFSLKVLLIPALILVGYGLYAAYMFVLSNNNPIDFSPIVRGIPKYKVALRNLIFPAAILIATTSTLVFLRKINLIGRKLSGFILITLIIIELFRFGWKFTPFSPKHIVFPETPIIKKLQEEKELFRVSGGEVIPINMLMPYYLERLEGYDAVYLYNVAKLIAVTNSERVEADPQGRYGTISNPNSRILALANVKYYLAKKYDAKGNPDNGGVIPKEFNSKYYRVIFEDKTVVILENNQALPRAFVVNDWEVVKDDDKALELLLEESFPINSKIILEKDPMMAKSAKSIDTVVRYKEYKDQFSTIDVRTEKNGMLFISDAYYPGWKVYVDGMEVEIFRADYAFRAVPIPKGDHEVRFVYHPDSFYNGLKIAVISILALVATVVMISKKKTQKLYLE